MSEERTCLLHYLHATIYRALGLSPDLEYETPIGRPIKRSEGKVITEILS